MSPEHFYGVEGSTALVGSQGIPVIEVAISVIYYPDTFWDLPNRRKKKLRQVTNNKNV